MKNIAQAAVAMPAKTMPAAVAMAAMAAGVLVGCGTFHGQPETAEVVGPEIVLCYGEVNPEGHIMTESAHYFADKVRELSSGKVLVEIYPSGQIGDDAWCYQAMQMGSLDLYRGNSASLAECGNPMVSALALPYIFRDREHFWNVCDSELGSRILNDIQESCAGMIGLAYLDEGARNFMTTDKPISRLEDMKGLEFRMQVSELMMDTVSALGASALPISYVELYTALQAGTVDGAENPPVSYYYNKFYQVAPYYVKDGHTYAPGVILVSELTWEKLGEEYQEVIREAAWLTKEYNRKEIEKADELAYENLEKAGVTITELEDLPAWNAAMEPVYRKHGSQFLDLIDEIKQMR